MKPYERLIWQHTLVTNSCLLIRLDEFTRKFLELCLFSWKPGYLVSSPRMISLYSSPSTVHSYIVTKCPTAECLSGSSIIFTLDYVTPNHLSYQEALFLVPINHKRLASFCFHHFAISLLYNTKGLRIFDSSTSIEIWHCIPIIIIASANSLGAASMSGFFGQWQTWMSYLLCNYWVALCPILAHWGAQPPSWRQSISMDVQLRQ